MLKILLKFSIFDQHGPANREIGQNQEILVTLKILLKFKIFVCPVLQSIKFGKIKIFESCNMLQKLTQLWDYFLSAPTQKFGKIKIFESHLQFDSNLRLLSTPVLQTMKLGKIKKFFKSC